ncbi:phosphoglycolate phosphatase [Thioclava sp. SK-1]|uniref:phosphoglycolate phosphatase n=1 Tax=Thioclava sp. SK-1 TaxID=1889770 RepID=UPI0008260A6A|nr:phosphoglycolate phosphatase [Thioclava sp. SK-1]OCX63145.1 phosphoglycolate phosphatase [Thioclava sp. SK-1]
MKPALIFDLDGTLIDSAPAIHSVTNYVLGEMGYPMITLSQTRSFIGRGTGHLVACVLKTAGQPTDGVLFDKMHSRFVERYAIDLDGNHQYPHVRTALDALVMQGYRMAICTNKPYVPAMAALEHVGLLDVFDVVIGGDSLQTRKPDPAILRKAHTDLGGGSLIYIGDSEVDAQTAQAAGCPFVLYTEGYCHRPVHDLPHDVAFSDWRMFPGIIDHMVKAM